MNGLMSTQRKILVSAALVLGAAGLGGCASTSDVANLQGEVNQARQEAQDAKQQAMEANRKADRAVAAATEAQNAAANAQKAAADANMRLDRSFKKTMSK